MPFFVRDVIGVDVFRDVMRAVFIKLHGRVSHFVLTAIIPYMVIRIM